MEQLSSCYFCGAALDAQIEPYRVVPASLDPSGDEQRAVSLCPACRQKLAQIVDTVVAATDAADPTDAIDEVPELDPEGGLLEEEPIDPAAGGADASGEDERSRDAPDGSSGERTAERDDEAGDTQASENRTIERTRSSHSGQGTGGGSRSGERRQRDDRSGQSGDPLDSGERGANGTEQRQSGRDGGSDAQYSSGTRAGERDGDDRAKQTHDDAGDDGPSLTALEYNKVMRLLQNREFPVERAEIHEVATSAYDITDREFDAIIDAAIQRGLIDEQNGQLVGGD
jgi:hypothetical protein